jgi:hypothetical protein
MHYRLVGQTPVPCDDLIEWAQAFEPSNRRVRLTRIGRFRVSTVFLGLDHNWGFGPPILFETMTFVDDGIDAEGMNERDDRYATWLEAEAGHQRAVKWLQANFCALMEQPVEVTE